jgi:hypothetical protein
VHCALLCSCFGIAASRNISDSQLSVDDMRQRRVPSRQRMMVVEQEISDAVIYELLKAFQLEIKERQPSFARRNLIEGDK